MVFKQFLNVRANGIKNIVAALAILRGDRDNNTII
jgi:hypothetical protein